MHHKVRELLVAQRTQLLNALRSHLAEIGIIAAQGPNNARALATIVIESNHSEILPQFGNGAAGVVEAEEQARSTARRAFGR